MAEYEDREHYIPLRKGDLIQLVCNDAKVPPPEREGLNAFCTLISAIYHFEYLERLEKLKDAYAPFDPDSQTTPLKVLADTQRDRMMDQTFHEVVSIMERANFKRLTQDDISAAIDGGASDWGLNMTVDFKIFERIEVFVRGDTVGMRTRRHAIWKWKKIEIGVEQYKRMVILLKMRPHKSLPQLVDTQGVFLKLFKDIPKLDIEMVLPGARIQMPGLQRLKLGGSLFGTIGYALYTVGAQILGAVTKLAAGAAAGLTSVLMGPIMVLAGYGYKQWYSFNVTKQTYSKQLTESLYYQTLDNNAGVLTHLIDEAEEQECREAILAYWCLRYHAPEQGWSEKQLDDYVELYLENETKIKVDFEIEDALDKVLELGIVERRDNPDWKPRSEGSDSEFAQKYDETSRYLLKAVPLKDALEKLDYKWDNYFQYNV